MSRRPRNRTQQENQQHNASAEKKGPNPIKVLAFGIAGLLIIIAIANLLIGSFANGSTQNTDKTAGTAAPQLGGALAPMNNGVQEVALSMTGYQYQPTPIRVKVGVPVRFTTDLSTVRGCMRSIVIPELGVSGRVSEGSNTIEFTPTKAGTFRMTCSMGMGQGTIVIEDANGQVPITAQAAAPVKAAGSDASCGAGGGCGCGG